MGCRATPQEWDGVWDGAGMFGEAGIWHSLGGAQELLGASGGARGRIRWRVFPGSLNTNCLRGSAQLWCFVFHQTPVLAQGDILLHCPVESPRQGTGMGLKSP